MFLRTTGAGETVTIPRTRLVEWYRMVAPPQPLEIEELAREFGARVVFTPPYWPEVQAMEKWNNNLKSDYYDRKPDERPANIGVSIREFAQSVTEADVEGWVGVTDAFCRGVVDRDLDILGEIYINLLPDA